MTNIISLRSAGLCCTALCLAAGCATANDTAIGNATALSTDGHELIETLDAGIHETAQEWRSAARIAVANRAKGPRTNSQAKNVILFVGDGMGPTTVAAARIFAGQQAGRDGESNSLSFEEFPHVAFSKTYTTDFQVPDSAGTATAMLTGAKTRSRVLGVSENVDRGDCATALASPIPTLAEYAEIRGLSTGIVTTTSVTHATPASTYAHTPHRNWENDTEVPQEAKDAGCIDIATQLINFPYGDGIDIVLGGGRSHFLPKTIADVETGEAGGRSDGVDLLSQWSEKSSNHYVATNQTEFRAAPDNAKLLGVFEPEHMKFELDRLNDAGGEPSLSQMTERAISSLSQNDKGFFLLVEGGRIDHAHHGGNAKRALEDTVAFADAVTIARDMTSERDTLIIVTADHGHTLTFQGYPSRGNDILDIVKIHDDDGELEPAPARGDKRTYTTLAYANGPGAQFWKSAKDGRPAITSEEATHDDHQQQAIIDTGSETHGGQDVGVYASGPGADLVSGVMEQNVIFQIMMDAYGW